MTEHSPHLLIAGGRRVDRVRAITDEPLDQMASCHERRSGPFTGLRTVLRGIVPEANTTWPELVATHLLVLTYLVPELSDVVGAAPRTLVDSTPHEERTRYFGNTAPLIAGFVLHLIGHDGAQAAIWALPFVFTFIGGIFADLLETRRRRLVSWALLGSGAVYAALAAAAVFTLG